MAEEKRKELNYLSESAKGQLSNWTDPSIYQGTIQEALDRIHRRINPKIVFLTQTSSIPYGFAFKEAWKQAYPKEEPPKFLTIDVKEVRKLTGHSEQDNAKYNFENRSRLVAEDIIRKVRRKLDLYGVKEGDRVLVLDEHYPDEGQAPVDKDRYTQMGTIGIAKKIVQQAAEKTGKNIGVTYSYFANKRLEGGSYGPWVRGGYSESYSPTRRYSGKEERDISKSNIAYLKNLGREAGIRLHREAQKKKSLEQRLSAIIGIVGFGSSTFFLGSNITGNAIGTLSQSSGNFIGIVLFLVGIVSALFYFKSKK